MEVSTSIPTRFSHETDGARADTMFYFSVDDDSGLSGDMLGHGVTRKSIGHSVGGDLGSMSELAVYVSGEFKSFSGELLFVA